MKKVLVLCTGNSYRSQIVNDCLQQYSRDKAKINIISTETHDVNLKILTVRLNRDNERY